MNVYGCVVGDFEKSQFVLCKTWTKIRADNENGTISSREVKRKEKVWNGHLFRKVE